MSHLYIHQLRHITMTARVGTVREGQFVINWNRVYNEQVQNEGDDEEESVIQMGDEDCEVDVEEVDHAESSQVTVELRPQELFCTLVSSFDSRNQVIHLEVRLGKQADGKANLQSPALKATIFASKDGDRHKVLPARDGTPNTWRNSWPHAAAAGCPSCSPSCNSCGARRRLVSFEVLVDFGPASEPLERSPAIRPGQQNVLAHMEKLLEDRDLADVTFKFSSCDIKAHSIILLAGSPVLAAMFRHDFQESRSRIIEVSDIKPEVFQQLLQYLYTGTAKELAKMAEDLLAAADKYQVDLLKEECAALLAKKLRLDNVIRVLVLAHLHSCPDLYQSSLNFIAKNAKSVCAHPDWMELIKNHPELCLHATQRIAGI